MMYRIFVIAIAFSAVTASCAHRPQQFWDGKTDPDATIGYAHYDSVREQLDGKRYRDAVKLFGPGRFEGYTDDRQLLFVWKGFGSHSGALMVVCDSEGRIVNHLFVIP